ncbi:MAG: hypothetical protein FJY88_01145 [Candidatus Eisenbacteria bacterium]|nr:hypothetical protein [Candidatus Eisenbacteria bacterium]
MQFATLADSSLGWQAAGVDAVALGVHMIGSESWIDQMTQGRAMPLLQDDSQTQAMASRGIHKDDLLILDRAGNRWKQVPLTNNFNLAIPHVPDTVLAWVRRVP